MKNKKNYEVEFLMYQNNEIINTGNLDTYLIEKIASEKVDKYKKALKMKRWEAQKLREEKGEFLTTYQNTLEELCKMDYTISELKVLLYLMSITDYSKNSFINKTHKEIGEELNISREGVTRALKKLHDRELINRIKAGSREYIQINSRVGFKGRLSEGYKKHEEEKEVKKEKENKFKSYEV